MKRKRKKEVLKYNGGTYFNNNCCDNLALENYEYLNLMIWLTMEL